MTLNPLSRKKWQQAYIVLQTPSFDECLAAIKTAHERSERKRTTAERSSEAKNRRIQELEADFFLHPRRQLTWFFRFGAKLPAVQDAFGNKLHSK